MSEQPRTVAEDWRRVRGWVPWLFAGVYFPLYVVLDLVAGGLIAAGLGLPRSVSVAGFSLAVALVVTSAVTLSRFESVSLSDRVDTLDLGARVGSAERSTVGSAGAVDRKSVRPAPSTTESIDPPAAGAEASADGGTTDAAHATDDDEWPDEWIPGDKL